MKKIIFIAIALVGFLSNAQEKVVVRDGNVYNEIIADSLYVNGSSLSDVLNSLPSNVDKTLKEETYASTKSVSYDETAPNFYIDLDGDISLSITDITSGSGIVNFIRDTGDENITLNGIKVGFHKYPTGSGEVVRLAYSYETGGVVWYCSSCTESESEIIVYNPNLIEIGGQSNAFGFAGNSTYPLDPKYSYSITNETPLTYVASGGKDSDYNLMTLEIMDFENSKGWENVNILEAYGIEFRLFEILKNYYNQDFYMIKTSQPSTQLVEAGSSTIDWSVNSTDEYYEWSNDHHDAAVALMPSQLAPAYYIWIQGEEDITQGTLSSYQEELEDFIAAKRAYYNYPEMPFIIVRMGNLQTFYNDDIAAFRAIQETVASQPYNILVDADGAATQDDNVHYTGDGYKLIAERIAVAMGIDASSIPVELTGTSFSSPYYLEGTNDTYSHTRAFDDNSATAFVSEGSGGDVNKYVGLDLGAGNEAILKKALLFPRGTFDERIQGVVVQGSNTSETTGFVTISDTVGTDTVEGEFYQLNGTDETTYRYIRIYLSGPDLDISEIKLYGY